MFNLEEEEEWTAIQQLKVKYLQEPFRGADHLDET